MWASCMLIGHQSLQGACTTFFAWSSCYNMWASCMLSLNGIDNNMYRSITLTVSSTRILNPLSKQRYPFLSQVLQSNVAVSSGSSCSPWSDFLGLLTWLNMVNHGLSYDSIMWVWDKGNYWTTESGWTGKTCQVTVSSLEDCNWIWGFNEQNRKPYIWRSQTIIHMNPIKHL